MGYGTNNGASLNGDEKETIVISMNGEPRKPNLLDRIKNYKFPKITRETFSWENMRLFVFLVATIISGTGNRIFFKKMGDAMPNYAFFLSNLTTLIYIPIFFGVVAYLRRFTDNITDDMVAFPKYKYLVMGALDAVSGILSLFGNTAVPGALQTLLNQGVIPITMLASFIFLGVRYKWNNYLGALVILAAIGISLINQFKPQGGQSLVINPIWCVLYFSSNIPSALSGVYKEIAFKAQPMDIYYLNAWVALWQFIIGLLLFPVNLIPLFGGLPLSAIPSALGNGAKCLVGINSILHGNGRENIVPDNCHGAWVDVLLYMVFNIAYNVFLLLVLKYGSAALMYISSAVILPLGAVAFSFKWVVPYAQPLDHLIIVGLVLILVGLGIYRFNSGGDEEKTDDEETETVPIFGPNQSDAARAIKHPKPQLVPRTSQDIRSTFYRRLGVLGQQQMVEKYY